MDGEIIQARYTEGGTCATSFTISATARDEDVVMADVQADPAAERAFVIPEDDTHSPGVRIKLVTAELARKYAKATPKEISTPTNGVAAFNGSYVSVDTTLVKKSLHVSQLSLSDLYFLLGRYSEGGVSNFRFRQ
jgi:hypothetical protein